MTSATVPMIAPNGDTGDIPRERAQSAIAAGFKPAMVMTSPDGQTGYIPQERAADAVKAGFKAGQAISPDAAGLQPAADHFDPVESFGQGMIKSGNAAGDFIEALHHPEQHQEFHNAQGIKAKLKVLLDMNNPLPPDQGQGMGNRVAEGAGNAVGQSIQGEAILHAPAAIEDIPGGLRAASKAVVEKSSAAVQKAGPIFKAVSDVAPDALGVISPRALHGVNVVTKGARIFGTLRDAIRPSMPEVGVEAAPDTSVPASSVSMTQFPPPLRQASMDALKKFGAAADKGARLSLPSSTAEMPSLPQSVATQIKAVLDDANAKASKLISDTEKSYPKKGTFADVMDDAAASQEANWDMEKQMYRGLSEERQKFFADNAPTFNKGQLVAREQVGQILNEASQKAAKILDDANLPSETRKKLIASISATEPTPPTTSAPAAAKPIANDDMTEILRRSVEAVKRSRKGKVISPGSSE